MNWTRFILTILAAGIGSSLTDWLFGGVLFHEKYKHYPEVWRSSVAGHGENKAIASATLLGFVTCAAFIFVCVRLNFYNYHTTLKLALAIWAIAPVPLIITNSLFMKLHPAIVFSHSLGWLAKLAIAALAVVWILAPVR